MLRNSLKNREIKKAEKKPEKTDKNKKIEEKSKIPENRKFLKISEIREICMHQMQKTEYSSTEMLEVSQFSMLVAKFFPILHCDTGYFRVKPLT